MVVLVRVLMLLACGPLLLPPGRCVCDAGVAHGTPADAPPLGCGHDHSHESDAPAPDDHAPGCPAADVGAVRGSDAQTEFAGTLLSAFASGTDPVPAAKPLMAARRTVPPRPAPRPLFLTHCSLVI